MDKKTTRNITSLLKAEQEQCIDEALAADHSNDINGKITWQIKRSYLNSYLIDFRSRRTEKIPGKTVFISYSSNTGEIFFKYIRNRLMEEGFEVLTGFDKAEEDQDNVLKRVLTQLKRSSIYFGLLTKEMEVIIDKNKSLWSPSVWVMEEKGMALALGKPFVLMVEHGIHGDFWQKTAPLKVHYLFNQASFFDNAQIAIEAIKNRYEEVAIAALRDGYLLPR